MKKVIMGMILTSHLVTVTVYQPVPEQTDSTPDRTAFMSKINLSDPLSHRWIAVSRDLEDCGFTFCKTVCIDGLGDPYDGDWEIHDRMNARWRNKIDLLIGLDDPIGKWDSITIELLD
jgi:hypothetical protein